jgi:hypothetical protein
MEVTYSWPPWLSESYHPQVVSLYFGPDDGLDMIDMVSFFRRMKGTISRGRLSHSVTILIQTCSKIHMITAVF